MFFNRNKCVLSGFILLAVILAEFFICTDQPHCAIGIDTSVTKNGFYISSIAKGSPADKALLKDNHFYKKIGNLSYEKFLDKEHIADFEAEMSSLFNYNEDYTFEDFDGNVFNISLKERNILKQLLYCPAFSKIKLLITLGSIICGIFISFYYGNDKKNKSTVYFIYYFSLAVYNSYSSLWDSAFIIKLATVLFDFGSLLAVSTLISFTIKVYYFESGRITTRKSIVHSLPFFAFLIKYCSIYFFDWTILDNPLFFMAQYISGSVSVICMIVFFYILFCFKGKTTSVMRFFLMGSFYSLLPACIFLLKYAFSFEQYVLYNDKVISIVPLIFLPLSIVFSICSSWGKKNNKTVINIISWFGYSTVGFILLFFANKYLKIDMSFYKIFICIMLAPILFKIIEVPPKLFLSIDSSIQNRKITFYKAKVSTLFDMEKIFSATSEALKSVLGCDFVFFYIKIDNEWTCHFTEKTDKDTVDAMIEKSTSIKPKGTIQNLNGGFAVMLYQNNDLFGKIFISKKSNSEFYVSGEKDIAAEIAEIFVRRYVLIDNIKISNQLQDQNRKLIAHQNHTILSLANLIETRDGDTGEHVRRTALYTQMIALKALDEGYYTDIINENFISKLENAAPLHDVGKIAVSDIVLNKPGKLTAEEFEMMKKHTTAGYAIISDVLEVCEDKEYVQIALDVALYHHEKWNGKGYPKGLSGNDIPLCARIMAIADVFDALVSKRSYKEPMSLDRAFSIIEEEKGNQFDPVLAGIFLELREEITSIVETYS